jgi:Ca2+-binding RTX toxin-like protein
MSTLSISTMDKPLIDSSEQSVIIGQLTEKPPLGARYVAGPLFSIPSSENPVLLKTFEGKFKNISGPQPLSFDAHLLSVDSQGVGTETWYSYSQIFDLSASTDQYDTFSVSFDNPPVLTGGQLYLFYIEPFISIYPEDRTLYYWGEVEAQQGLPIGFASDPNYEVISFVDNANSLAFSLDFSDSKLTTREGTLRRDRLIGSKADDLINGVDGHDVINGGTGDDALQGENGNDKLRGGKDNDKLFGGAGKDLLNGGLGDDWLTGGSGADSFILSKGKDKVTDYRQDEGDAIEINSKIFTSFDLTQDGVDAVLTAHMSGDFMATLTIRNTSIDHILIKASPEF